MSSLRVATLLSVSEDNKRRKVEGDKKKKEEDARRQSIKEDKEAKKVADAHAKIGAWLTRIEDCPIFYATVEDLKDPISYIKSIEPEASKYGICIVRLPAVSCTAGVIRFTGNNSRFGTRVQTHKARNRKRSASKASQSERSGAASASAANAGNDGASRAGNAGHASIKESGKTYTVSMFEKFANDFLFKRYQTRMMLPAPYMEREYWRHCCSDTGVTVEYGNDIEGSAFPTKPHDPLSSTPWNLEHLPTCQQSALRSVTTTMPGVTEPMLYMGMAFSTFAWHVEDHYLYSINYNHMGAPKTWYGVPGANAEDFEVVAEREVLGFSRDRCKASAASPSGSSVDSDGVDPIVYEALMNKTTMFSPESLVDDGVPVFRAVQQPGDYVVTFPRAYHGGFNNGFNCCEAVNFATSNWFEVGFDAAERYRDMYRPAIIPLEEIIIKEILLVDDPRATDERMARAFVKMIHGVHSYRLRMEEEKCTTTCRWPSSLGPGTNVPCSECGGLCYMMIFQPADTGPPVCCECVFRSEYHLKSMRESVDKGTAAEADMSMYGESGDRRTRSSGPNRLEDSSSAGSPPVDTEETCWLSCRDSFPVSRPHLVTLKQFMANFSSESTGMAVPPSKGDDPMQPSVSYADLLRLAQAYENFFAFGEDSTAVLTKLDWSRPAALRPPRRPAYDSLSSTDDRSGKPKKGCKRKQQSTAEKQHYTENEKRARPEKQRASPEGHLEDDAGPAQYPKHDELHLQTREHVASAVGCVTGPPASMLSPCTRKERSVLPQKRQWRAGTAGSEPTASNQEPVRARSPSEEDHGAKKEAAAILRRESAPAFEATKTMARLEDVNRTANIASAVAKSKHKDLPDNSSRLRGVPERFERKVYTPPEKRQSSAREKQRPFRCEMGPHAVQEKSNNRVVEECSRGAKRDRGCAMDGPEDGEVPYEPYSAHDASLWHEANTKKSFMRKSNGRVVVGGVRSEARSHWGPSQYSHQGQFRVMAGKGMHAPGSTSVARFPPPPIPPPILWPSLNHPQPRQWEATRGRAEWSGFVPPDSRSREPPEPRHCSRAPERRWSAPGIGRIGRPQHRNS